MPLNDADSLTRMQLIGGGIRQLPLKGVYKNQLFAWVDQALRYWLAETPSGILTCLWELRRQLERKGSNPYLQVSLAPMFSNLREIENRIQQQNWLSQIQEPWPKRVDDVKNARIQLKL